MSEPRALRPVGCPEREARPWGVLQQELEGRLQAGQLNFYVVLHVWNLRVQRGFTSSLHTWNACLNEASKHRSSRPCAMLGRVQGGSTRLKFRCGAVHLGLLGITLSFDSKQYWVKEPQFVGFKQVIICIVPLHCLGFLGLANACRTTTIVHRHHRDTVGISCCSSKQSHEQ